MHNKQNRTHEDQKRELDAGHWTGHPFCVYGHRSESSGAVHPCRRTRRVWPGLGRRCRERGQISFFRIWQSLCERHRRIAHRRLPIHGEMGLVALPRHYGEHLLFCHGGHWHCNGLVLGQPLQHLKYHRPKCDPLCGRGGLSHFNGRIVSRQIRRARFIDQGNRGGVAHQHGRRIHCGFGPHSPFRCPGCTS